MKALTIEGAKALGLEDKIGSLEVGKQADFIAIQPKGRIHPYPLENMLSHLVYAVKGSDVQGCLYCRSAGCPRWTSFDSECQYKRLILRRKIEAAFAFSLFSFKILSKNIKIFRKRLQF